MLKFQHIEDLKLKDFSKTFKYFQALYLFSSTFVGLEFLFPNSSTFKDFSSTLWTLARVIHKATAFYNTQYSESILKIWW